MCNDLSLVLENRLIVDIYVVFILDCFKIYKTILNFLFKYTNKYIPKIYFYCKLYNSKLTSVLSTDEIILFPNWDGWAEWNGMYRDDVRRFMKGMEGSFATRVAGSSDLYQVNQRNPPYHGVNFIIAHDGFTLRDHTILRGNWQMKKFHLALMISQVKPLPTYMNDIVVNNLI
ncbi:unnamed protein product [Brassica rapa]|uniref:Uncharacterized protein n=1 Tax=Brassica campestris TaxID=3711 RepID=A0A3P6BNC4_BRACM|nr:unnamed protein product [Brassica rapa]VDD03050.1 unnamed protein product [Brassica rapa]